MQERSVCCRDVPWLAHMELGTGPLHPGQLLPSLSAWDNGTQFTGSLQEGWTWTVEWRFAASPTQILWFRIMYVILSLFNLESWLWSVYQMIVCLLLIAAIFLGWSNTTRNKWVSPCAFITFFLGCVANRYDVIWYLPRARHARYSSGAHMLPAPFCSRL